MSYRSVLRLAVEFLREASLGTRSTLEEIRGAESTGMTGSVANAVLVRLRLITYRAIPPPKQQLDQDNPGDEAILAEQRV